MRTMLKTLAVALAAAAMAQAQDKSLTGMYGGPANGIKWATSFEDALAQAKAQSKPIMLMHLLGRLDEEFC